MQQQAEALAGALVPPLAAAVAQALLSDAVSPACAALGAALFPQAAGLRCVAAGVQDRRGGRAPAAAAATAPRLPSNRRPATLQAAYLHPLPAASACSRPTQAACWRASATCGLPARSPWGCCRCRRRRRARRWRLAPPSTSPEQPGGVGAQGFERGQARLVGQASVWCLETVERPPVQPTLPGPSPSVPPTAPSLQAGRRCQSASTSRCPAPPPPRCCACPSAPGRAAAAWGR